MDNISPQLLTSYVSFVRDDINWIYDPSTRKSMQSKQAEGAAKLFNILNEKKIALLADEVGMGKTIQALSIMAMLWNQKPNAKILVLAPRYEIARNWQYEYGTFIKVHYKLNDDIVKSRFGNHEVNPATYCNNLYDMVKNYSEKWQKLFIGKISSFSALFSKTEIQDRLDEIKVKCNGIENLKENNKHEFAGKIGTALRNKLAQYSDSGTPFDLLIIDEAHYFRNKEGGSLRAAVAQSFFGNKASNKLADKVLLLTATPNHTSSENIKTIFSYFDYDNEYITKGYNEILEENAIRRFRRLTDAGYMKYNYRKEVELPANFSENPLSEVFFGLYQKKLAEEYMNETNTGSKRRMLNFLEGTEFIPRPTQKNNTKDQNEDQDSNDLRENNKTDFHAGTDKKILEKLSDKYRTIFQEQPAHPKYDKLIEQVKPTKLLNVPNEKTLIFARRIPSVREIAARINYKYDVRMLDKILTALQCDKSALSLANLTREKYKEVLEANLKDTSFDGQESAFENDDEDDNQGANYEVDNYGSKVLDLFKVLKKEDPAHKTTHASNFRLRFSRSKPGIFPAFFSPGANYFNKEYNLKKVIQSQYSSETYDDNIFATFLEIRTKSLKEDTTVIKIRNLLKGKENNKTRVAKPEETRYKLKTLLTVFWDYLKKNREYYSKYEALYKALNSYQKEAFSKFLEKGVLLASSAIVDLYAIFIIVIKKHVTPNRMEFYNYYMDQLEADFDNTILPELIMKSLERFPLIVEKVFNITDDETLINWDWKNFFDAQPAYPYWGSTKNERTIVSFNTPFFPDILISTSVLQEGVNLQYFCDKVIHYGIAWTPGDNEQRVGRIDRMFGKIEQQLQEQEKAYLNILYPYLTSTVDQDHLADFIYKKYTEEERIDRCQSSAEHNRLNYSNLNTENWRNYFRQPVIDKMDGKDPYGVNISTFPRFYKHDAPFVETNHIKQRIVDLLNRGRREVFFSSTIGDPTENSTTEICILNEKLSSGRVQPVFVEIDTSPIISGLANETIHILTLRTPLGFKSSKKKFFDYYSQYKEFYELLYPTVKLCIDSTQSNDSAFFIYMKLEIPLFPESSYSELSKYEIESNIDTIRESADYIEKIVFNEEQDIELKQLNINAVPYRTISKNKPIRSTVQSDNLKSPWKIKNSFALLEGDIRTKDIINQELAWIKNHEYPFIKWIVSNEDLPRIQVSFLRIDIQLKESELLKRIFDYFKA